MNHLRVIFFVSLLFVIGCSHVTIKSELAPDAGLTKEQPLYLEAPTNVAINHQKYLHVLRLSLKEQGINLLENRNDATYIMKVIFKEFMAGVNLNVPTAQTSVTSGSIGRTPVYGMTTTYGSETVERSIPTHNSLIQVTDMKTGRLVWQVLIAKSYDIYEDSKLRSVLFSALSLYGKEGDASKLICDEMRW